MSVTSICRYIGRSLTLCSIVYFILGVESRAASQFPFCRGIAVNNIFGSAEVSPKRSTNYIWPPFRPPYYNVTAKDISSLRQHGFDFIRLVMDPGIFVQETGSRREQLYALVEDRIRMVIDAGVGVVLDIHPFDHNKEYGEFAFAGGPESPLFERYREMVARLATTLSQFPSNKVALELLNEPAIQPGWKTMYRWQRIATALHGVAREHAPDLWIVVSVGQWGHMEGLDDIRPAAFDNRTAFTIHYYLPYDFTHQNIRSSKQFRNIAGLPFPSVAGDAEHARSVTDRLVDEDPDLSLAGRVERKFQLHQRIDAYFRSGANQGTIRADFDRIGSWADQNNVARSNIWIGEFGVVRSRGKFIAAAEADALRWLSALREEAELHGFAWSIWDDTDGAFSVHRHGSNADMDAAMLEALGLGSNARRCQ